MFNSLNQKVTGLLGSLDPNVTYVITLLTVAASVLLVLACVCGCPLALGIYYVTQFVK